MFVVVTKQQWVVITVTETTVRWRRPIIPIRQVVCGTYWLPPGRRHGSQCCCHYDLRTIHRVNSGTVIFLMRPVVVVVVHVLLLLLLAVSIDVDIRVSDLESVGM